nr:MAG TPA: hypothetical protein [Caudoviricetes sp.]
MEPGSRGNLNFTRFSVFLAFGIYNILSKLGGSQEPPPGFYKN